MGAPELIQEICPSCNPQTYQMSVAKYINQEEEGDLLYQCEDCEAKIWVGEEWAKRNELKDTNLTVTERKVFNDFDSLDLDNIYRELTKKTHETLGIHTFLSNKFREHIKRDRESEFVKFLKTEIDIHSKELDRLISISKSLNKIRYWDVL